ncbi:protoheme IX farnesyltransferase [Geoalkalibacter sp.]|uniref:protoheme IX farnesyltransferase n=1 Tax=Geoalkalibacter sp. TaxID=3041440 RepID=UPI00272E282D|nr:UbiA family prenyltransferase [Geoalkalibacter sp.]
MMEKFFLPMARLLRLRLSLGVGLSATAGYLLHGGMNRGTSSLLVGLAVAVLAGGCSALNQVQERRIDARMHRTCRRPLASGQWPVAWGLGTALVLLGAGMLLLSPLGIMPLALAGGAVLWYNGLYTWLKRRSAFAVLPGALCGALPPLIGWCAAGGAWSDHRAISLALVFFLWQMPHFWLLLSGWREDYRRAGLPHLFDRFSSRQSGRVIALWILALASSLLLLPALGLLRSGAAATPYLAAVTGLALLALLIPTSLRKTTGTALFAGLNLAMLTATLALMLDQLLF